MDNLDQPKGIELDQLHIAIGYDPREAVAYHVCANSAIRHSSLPIVFHPLALKNFKGFYEERHNTKTGLTQTEPTNQFIFSRFLTPYLMGFKGLALFVDGDQIFRDDPAKLFDLHQWGKAVSVVKHDYKTKFPIKYLNQPNMDYERKNWSSVMLFDCGHFDCKKLTPEYVQGATGKQLHRLEWTNEEHIGELPIEWNWLPDEMGANYDAKLIHHTAGTPCFLEPQYSMGPMSEEWHRECQLTNFCLQTFVP